MSFNANGLDAYGIKRVREITVQLVAAAAHRGDFDMDNPADLKEAVRVAANDARAAYLAAMEYICG